jgi:hypothetical protein
MLFDLKGKRKRAVQITYLGLAFLLAAGLIGAGIGSSTSGGLFDAITGGGGGGSSTADKTIQKRIDAAQSQLTINPKNEAAYAIVVRSHYQLATAHSNQQGVFDAKGVAQLQQAASSWSRYVTIAKNPDPSLAALMVQAYTGMAQSLKTQQDQKQALTGAADAAEVVASARPSVNGYLQLVQYARRRQGGGPRPEGPEEGSAAAGFPGEGPGRTGPVGPEPAAVQGPRRWLIPQRPAAIPDTKPN